MMLFRSRLKNLSLLADGKLTPAEVERMRKKVTASPPVKKEFDALIAMEEAMQQPVPANFRDRVLAKLPPVERCNQPVRGRVLSICGGDVRITRNGKAGLPAIEDMDIKRGDRIDIGPRSLALVELNDRSQLYLNSNTSVVLPPSEHALEFPEGQIFAQMRRQTEPFVIQTPSAALCVLGTEFDAKVKKDSTRLQVLKGAVKYSNTAGVVVAKRRQEVQASAFATPLVKRLTREKVAESRWRNVMKLQEKRESTMKKWLWGFVVLGILLLAAGWVYLWGYAQTQLSIQSTILANAKKMHSSNASPAVQPTSTSLSQPALSAADLSWADDPQYWEPDHSSLQKLPQVFILRPSRLPRHPSGYSEIGDGTKGRILAIGIPVSQLIREAYGLQNWVRLVDAGMLLKDEKEKYDLMMTLDDAEANKAALQQALKEQLGINIKKEMRSTEVFSLKVVRANATGLKLPSNDELPIPANYHGNGCMGKNKKISTDLIPILESFLSTPIIDQTNLTGNYDIQFQWDENLSGGKKTIPSGFSESLSEQLGLELIPGSEPIEMLVVERNASTASTYVASTLAATDLSWADDPKYWELSANSAFQNDSAFQKLPSTFILRPSRFPNKHSRKGKRDTGNRLDINVSVSELIFVAYDIVKTRAVFPATLPQDRYDLMMTLGNIEQNRGALQKALKERLGITVRKETRSTDVLLLKVARPNAPGLKQVNDNDSKNNFEIEMEIYDATNEPLSEHLVPFIESELGIPVIDKTGLSGRYGIHMKYQSTPDGKKVDSSSLQKALYELGLEVVPAIEPVEMLVVERTTTGTQQATPTPLPSATTPTSATQTSTLAPNDLGIDIAKITDPAARAAVEQIQQKIAKIQDYQCVIDTTITMQKETTGETQDEREVAQMKETAKRPAFWRAENTTLLYTKKPDLQGSIQITITDGQTIWSDSGVVSQTIWSDSGVVSIPNESRKRNLCKQDLAYFRKVTPEESKDLERCYYGRLFLPFFGMDAAQMTIVREDKDVWIFSDTARELTIGKNDGLRRAVSSKRNGKITRLETISDIKTNIGVPQNMFALKLEPGDTIRDVTADTVKAFKNKSGYTPLGASESLDLTSKESVYRGIARVGADMRSIATGVESYKVDNKAYPKTLQALTAPVAYLSKIPNDPFVLDKNEPYHYRSTDPAHWEGWSVGPDGKDDQGGIFYDSANGFVSPGDIVYTQEDF